MNWLIALISALVAGGTWMGLVWHCDHRIDHDGETALIVWLFGSACGATAGFLVLAVWA